MNGRKSKELARKAAELHPNPLSGTVLQSGQIVRNERVRCYRGLKGARQVLRGSYIKPRHRLDDLRQEATSRGGKEEARRVALYRQDKWLQRRPWVPIENLERVAAIRSPLSKAVRGQGAPVRSPQPVPGLFIEQPSLFACRALAVRAPALSRHPLALHAVSR